VRTPRAQGQHLDTVTVQDPLGQLDLARGDGERGLFITPLAPTLAPRATRLFSASGVAAAGFLYSRDRG